MNIKKLLHEPLLHFLLIGAGLFLLYGQLNDSETQTPNRITITQADVDRLAQTWLRRTGRFPDEQEKQAQLQSYIREQVLYREARQLGLDQNDIIVRRRLAQKMEFLFRDLTFIDKPDEASLVRYLQENPARFMQPARLSFTQVYIDINRHGEQARGQAEKILQELRSAKAGTSPAHLGDAIMLPVRQTLVTGQQIASQFGDAFASKLLTLSEGQWLGPIESAYGLHLVKISERKEAVLPELASIRAQVESQWRASEQRKANAAFYQGLRQRYDVVLDMETRSPTRLSAK